MGSFKIPKPFDPMGLPTAPDGFPLVCRLRVAVMNQQGFVAPGTDTTISYNLVLSNSPLPMTISEFFQRGGEFEKGLDYLKRLTRARGEQFNPDNLLHMDQWRHF